MSKQKSAALIAGGLLSLGLFFLLRRKAEPIVYVCPYCNIEFATEAELLQHIEQEHPEEPPVTVEEFRFTEIAENQLPEYIIGWSQATCSGPYNYVPPAGYVRTSCEASVQGSHGGCPACLMSRIRCDKAE